MSVLSFPSFLLQRDLLVTLFQMFHKGPRFVVLKSILFSFLSKSHPVICRTAQDDLATTDFSCSYKS